MTPLPIQRNNRTVLVLLAAIIAITQLAERPAHAQRKKVITVGVVRDGKWAGGDMQMVEIKQQVQSLGGVDHEFRFPESKSLDGDFDRVKIGAALDKLLADPAVDMIYAMGVLTGNEAGTRPKLSKPVIAPFVIDRKLQGLPFNKGTSGRKNLMYLEWPWSIERDLEVFREVARVTEIIFLLDKSFIDAFPAIAERAAKQAKEQGIAMTVVGASSLEEALAAVPSGTRAVYLAPLSQMPLEDKKTLIGALTKRRIATFSLLGELEVKKGALVGRRPGSSSEQIARRVALASVRIADGQDAGTLTTSLRLPERLMINMKTARTVGLSPSWGVLTEAELIATERDVARQLTLESVIKEALEGNVDIKAAREAVRAGSASLRSAKANLLPQVDLSTSARLIDRDRAATSFGSAPRVLWTGDISVNQVLFSEAALGGLSAERSVQRSREQQVALTELDVAAEVAVAYLNVVRAKTGEKIQRANLKITRANLDLARTRVDAGSASKADIYRWESQIARDRKSLIELAAQRNLAEIDLSRILHRPTEEPFGTEDELLGSEVVKRLDGLQKYVGDPWTFKIFRRFMVEEALASSPELKQFDAAIAAQARLLKSAKRAPYSPTVALAAGLTQRFYRGGTGSTGMMGEANGTDWFVGLNVSLPLYTGGSRYADIDRNSAEISRLKRERESLADRISQRAASTLHQMGASYAGIRLSREAADAAKKNYELIATAYAQGAVRIVDVLDAQNAWTTADQLAADSVYGFLIDWMNVQRAVGQFGPVMSTKEREELISRAMRYIAREAEKLETRGVTGAPPPSP